MDIEKIKQNKSTEDLLKFSIINIDKPSGPTSFTVSQFVKHSFKLNKTSHFGTLDPMVSGVLPIGISRACRLNEYLMHRDKTYVGIMRLHAEVPEKALRELIQKFIGKIQQTPPVKSRVKRVKRTREVKSFNVLEIDGKDILFETQVEAGTYIRKICDDMGKEIGGAHMLELRRTQAGIFNEKTAHTLDAFEKALKEYEKSDDKALRAMLIPGEIVATLLPTINVISTSIKKLYTGSPLFTEFIETDAPAKKEDKIAVLCKNVFIGCYRIANEGTVRAVPEFVCN